MRKEYRKEFRAAKENLLKAKHALNAAKAKEKKEVIETYKVKFDQLKKQQTEGNKLAIKKSLRDLKQEFKREKEANSPEIIELEYQYTSALGEYNRIKDTIRSATEDDYILTKKVTN